MMTLLEVRDRLSECLREIDAILLSQAKCIHVTYRSQWDADGDHNKSDCGPACLAMVLEHYGQRIAINQLASEAGMSPSKRYTLPADLVRAAALHGVSLVRKAERSVLDLRNEVAAGRPVIALIHYASFGKLRQDAGWNGGHWVVVVGVKDEAIYIHDPDWQGEQRGYGQNLAIPRAIFEDAWARCNVDGNTPHQGLWVVGVSYRNETGGTTTAPSMAST